MASHHYVPEWYQRRFLEPGKTTFQVLDLNPQVHMHNGVKVGQDKSVLRNRGPNNSFCEPGFYSARWLDQVNDEIETQLFGRIDAKGKLAIDAFLAEDWNTVHHTYGHMFEFMDAQRLRTPKGLRFLGSLIPDAPGRNQLLILMQRLRLMHCVMWQEGYLEIVSAEQSPTKFIYSDHPVTFFNRLVFPKAPEMAGRDPAQKWRGTQTLYPLDKDRLFVLTHLEWPTAQTPRNARASRTNARYFDGGALARYDKCARGRQLTESQVLEVNYIIKARADRYIAAATEEGLFPERRLKTTMWSKLGTFLLPSDTLKSGGDIFMGMADGTIRFQDKHGRRPRTLEEQEARQKEGEAMRSHFEKVMATHRVKSGPTSAY